ncbi:conserved hypothetical protein [Shewanella halifaxensis HAW-EB4]|uniref:Outer membrane cytochrome MtrC/MtrF-like domain-containing protein n=1 Tax=Shewanella halifaxensis (strain HAW-EB4) TaxID=458817 RepID=B0TRA6_SHEHH|nr:hypothetical protein [Shewanella halifaxensis]ABZ75078.1 conserved hypothetical protein [Shewanella halifaxensis HAW-EB4]
MRKFNKCSVALIVATAFGLAACSDGKDGSDDEDGISPLPPVVDATEITNVEVLSHTLEEGVVRFEFEVTNEEGLLVSGLEKVSAEVAELTDKGIARSRPDFEGTIAGGNANEETEGASLNMTENGRYEFLAPMPAVNAGTEGIIRLAVGGGENIAKSNYIVVDKTESLHTTSTATCHGCHVDYAASKLKHPSYTAINTDGETDLVAGCMVCHGNVVRDKGGYAKNTMQKIGHINHQKFEKDFEPANCYTCHAEPITKVNSMDTCTDCHDAAGVGTTSVAMTYSSFDETDDVRQFHKKVGERADIRAQHYTTTSAPYTNSSLEWDDHETTGGWCTDIALFNTDSGTDVQLNIAQLYAAGTLTYAGAYIHAYDNDSIVGRPSPRDSGGVTNSQYIENPDGSRAACYVRLDGIDAGFANAGFTASSRVTFKQQDDDGGYDGVSLTSYSDVVDRNEEKLQEYNRRHSVTLDSCTTCHNNETNYHKNGSYSDGGLDCVACHNNGQDRAGQRVVAMDAFETDSFRINAGYTIAVKNSDGEQTGWKANSAPGFGPLVHAQHWGLQSVIGSEISRDNEVALTNSAAKLNADNCVACHADGIDLNAVPNQYMLSRAFNGGNAGESGVASSPITANCFACHNNDQALNHMISNGGELNLEVNKAGDWFTQGTSESCATCHAEGRSYGIEKYHVFDRKE